MKYIVDMTLEVEETMALNVERSNSTNHKFLYTIKRYFSFFVKNAGKFHFFDCQILTSVEIKGILCIQKRWCRFFQVMYYI